MKPSTRYQIEGKPREVKGKVKEKAGQATSNPNLAAEGQAEKFPGERFPPVTSNTTAIALRVLTATNNHQSPTEEDLAYLRAQAPQYCDLPADELACMVIQRAVERRMKARLFSSFNRDAASA